MHGNFVYTKQSAGDDGPFLSNKDGRWNLKHYMHGSDTNPVWNLMLYRSEDESSISISDLIVREIDEYYEEYRYNIGRGEDGEDGEDFWGAVNLDFPEDTGSFITCGCSSPEKLDDFKIMEYNLINIRDIEDKGLEQVVIITAFIVTMLVLLGIMVCFIKKFMKQENTRTFEDLDIESSSIQGDPM